MSDVTHTQENGYDFGVPLPPATRGIAAQKSITGIIRNIPIGGSKFFPGKKYNQIGNLVQAAKVRKPIPFEVALREVEENGVKGVRVWRIDAE
jgi:hypothetical protein